MSDTDKPIRRKKPRPAGAVSPGKKQAPRPAGVVKKRPPGERPVKKRPPEGAHAERRPKKRKPHIDPSKATSSAAYQFPQSTSPLEWANAFQEQVFGEAGSMDPNAIFVWFGAHDRAVRASEAKKHETGPKPGDEGPTPGANHLDKLLTPEQRAAVRMQERLARGN